MRTAVTIISIFLSAFVFTGAVLSAPGRPAQPVTAPDAASRHFLTAQQDLRLHRLRQAISEYEAGVRLKPDALEARFNLAQLYMQAGRPADAIPEFDYVVQHAPSSKKLLRSTAELRLGAVYHVIHQDQRAVAEFQSVLAQDPGSADALLALGTLSLVGRNYPSAARYLQQYLRIVPGNSDVHYNLALIYVRQNLLPAAVQEFRISASTAMSRSRRIGALVNAAAISSRLPRGRAETLKILTDLIRTDPRNANAWLTRGVEYQKQGDDSHALSDYGHVVQLNPRSVAGWFNKGVLDFRRKALSAAEQDFHRVLKLAPHIAAAGAYLADCYVSYPESRRKLLLGKARNLYLAAIKQDPKNVSAYAGLAYLEELSGNQNAATAQYEKLNQLRPHDPAVLARLASSYARRAVKEKPYWEKAIDTAREMTRLRPDDEEAVLVLSSFQSEAGREPDAITTLRAFTKTHPSATSAQLRLASLLSFPLSRQPEATAIYEGILKSHPDNLEALQAMAKIVEPHDPRAAAAYLERALPHLSGFAWIMAGNQLAELYRRSDPGQLPTLYEHMIAAAENVQGSSPEIKMERQYLPTLRVTLAQSLSDAGRLAEALAAYEEARKSDPGNVNLLVSEARLYEQQKDLLSARRAYLDVLGRQPDNLEAMRGYLKISLGLGGPEKTDQWAVSFLEKQLAASSAASVLSSFRNAAVEILGAAPTLSLLSSLAAHHGGSTELAETVAEMYGDVGQPASALSEWTRLIAEHPDRADFYAHRSALLERNRSLGDPLPDARTSARLQPANGDYERALLRLIEPLPNDVDEKVRVLTALVNAEPGDSTHAHQLARLYSGPDAARQRITLYRGLLQKLPASYDYHDQLAAALLENGDAAGARQEYEEALKLNPNDSAARTFVSRPPGH